MKIIPLEMTEDGWKTAEEEVEYSAGFSKGVYIHLAPFRCNGKDVFIPLRKSFRLQGRISDYKLSYPKEVFLVYLII